MNEPWGSREYKGCTVYGYSPVDKEVPYKIHSKDFDVITIRIPGTTTFTIHHWDVIRGAIERELRIANLTEIREPLYEH
jgi:hypothetical protein